MLRLNQIKYRSQPALSNSTRQNELCGMRASWSKRINQDVSN